MKTRSNRKTRAVTILVIAIFIMTAIFPAVLSAAPRKGPYKATTKNVIVMIADGWDINHVNASSYYQYGKAAKQVYNKFPFSFAMSTYMAYYKDDLLCYGSTYDPAAAWGYFDYVNECPTDSAAAATAMSTGAKTFKGAIGVDLDEQPLLNVIERAEEKGKATGVITSVEWSHATPAGFVAHNPDRNEYAAIAQEMVYDSAVDVIMGAGHPWYDKDGQFKDIPNTFKYVGGVTTWDDLVAGTAGGDADGDGVDDPWILIEERVKFQAFMNGPTPKRVLGTAQVYQTLQQGRTTGDEFADPYVAPLIETVPTLEEMSLAAINILDDDPDGFFLMIEGGAVDWASHDNQSGRMIEEQIDYDNAVQAVVDWVRANSNWGETLLIVTGDHETGYLTGPGSDPAWMPLVNNGAGVLPGMEWHSDYHTNGLIPLFVKGDAGRFFRSYALGRDPVHGRYIDNIDIANVVYLVLGP